MTCWLIKPWSKISKASAPRPQTMPVSTGLSTRVRAPSQIAPLPTAWHVKNDGGGGLRGGRTGGSAKAALGGSRAIPARNTIASSVRNLRAIVVLLVSSSWLASPVVSPAATAVTTLRALVLAPVLHRTPGAAP